MTDRSLCRPLVLSFVLATSLATSTALASPDLLLDGQTLQLSGKINHRVVRLLNGSRIEVIPYDGANHGRLEITAQRIMIDATSVINASGAGYQGRPNQDGAGLGGGKGSASSTDATGGGGHAGPGGWGVMLPGCTSIAQASGGGIYDVGAQNVTFGSAGAAAGTADGDDGGRGGNGGGVIVLRAGRIEIEGQLLADGASGATFNDDSSGGGAGGGIMLWASSFASFGGRLSAVGAPGGNATDDEGGAGGGGRVRLFVPSLPSAPDLLLLVNGGAASCSLAAGGAGIVHPPVDPGCLDLDGDGLASSECGGTDCDDSDPKVHPGAVEVCNGEDDDCSGQVDDHGAAQSCASGQCMDGSCVEPDGGPDAPSDGPVTDGPVADGPGADATADAPGPEDAQTDGALDAGADAQADSGLADALGPIDEETVLDMRGGCGVGGRQTGGYGAILVLAGLLLTSRKRSRN